LFRSVAEGRTLPEFQLIYITRGQGIYEVEDKSYTVTPGSVVLILPGIRHQYRPVFEIGWDEYWVGFKGDFFSRLVEEEYLSRGHIFFQIGLHNYILAIFNRIFEEVRSQQSLYQLKACSGILALIAEVLALERRLKQPDYYQKIVEAAKYFMDSNIFGAINVADISEHIGVSAGRLNEIFKTYTDMTPYQYYIHIKMLKAQSLLEQSNIPVKEVAYNLGFDDPLYFSRAFKNRTGMAPSEWKKRFYL
jgi:AraC-like DNA-binding protein